MVGETLTCTGTPAACFPFAEALHGSSSAGVFGEHWAFSLPAPSSPYPTGVPVQTGAWEQTALAVGNNAGETSWETCLW